MCEELGGACEKRGSESSGKVRLTSGLVGKRVEDPERRRTDSARRTTPRSPALRAVGSHDRPCTRSMREIARDFERLVAGPQPSIPTALYGGGGVILLTSHPFPIGASSLQLVPNQDCELARDWTRRNAAMAALRVLIDARKGVV